MQTQAFTRTGITPSGAQAFAARNLELLAAIENTLDALTCDTDLLRAISRTYQEIRDKLSDTPGEIDVGGRIGSMLEKASDACVRIYRDAQGRHQCACTDPELHPDDGVADAYAAFIEAIRDLHDDIESLREWIATHDAVLQPTTGDVFDSADDLFNALLSGR